MVKILLVGTWSVFSRRHLVSNLPLTRGVAGPRHLRTNIAVPSMTTSRRGLYLLPDRVLVRDGNHYASVTYSELGAEESQQRFIEDGPVPSDSRVLGHTWQYVNKSGGPDRRFNNNRQLPNPPHPPLSVRSNAACSPAMHLLANSATGEEHDI